VHLRWGSGALFHWRWRMGTGTELLSVDEPTLKGSIDMPGGHLLGRS